MGGEEVVSSLGNKLLIAQWYLLLFVGLFFKLDVPPSSINVCLDSLCICYTSIIHDIL